ncbi:MAG: YbaB/EbfC family nucleoid-associated protein [bacterium]
MDIQKVMKEMKKAQQRMAELQEEIAQKTVEASAGGGMVKAVVAGDGTLRSLVIDPQVVDPGDVQLLTDLILACVNEGKRRASELASTEMQKAAGAMGLPPGLI